MGKAKPSTLKKDYVSLEELLDNIVEVFLCLTNLSEVSFALNYTK